MDADLTLAKAKKTIRQKEAVRDQSQQTTRVWKGSGTLDHSGISTAPEIREAVLE